jgi:hypothetical protein
MKKAFLDHNYLSSTLKKANRMILVVKTIQRLNAHGALISRQIKQVAKRKSKMEMRGIDPRASRMLSERSTI